MNIDKVADLAKLQTIKAWIDANMPGQSEHVIAPALNATASPVYWVLKTKLGKHELTQQNGVDTDGTTPTTFVWGGAAGGYINRSQGERDAFKEIFNSILECNPSLPNVRTAFDDIFSGAGAGAQGNRAHCKAMVRKPATVGEQLFAIQTVGGPTQSGNRGTATNPDTLDKNAAGEYLEGEISVQTVIDALFS